jgi:hypothetical protein
MNKLKNIPRSYWINNKMKKQIKMDKKDEKTADNSKNFLLEFFKDAQIKDENGVLTINGVHSDFEKFVGKKAPYKFVFDINVHNKIKDSELIMQGSYFLLAIRDYLSDKGETSLVKINIKPELKELSKNPKFKKYKILEFKSSDFDFMYEFSFLSNYQYLNDKKQSTTKVLVKDKEILHIKLENFKTQKANIEEIPTPQPQQAYETARKVLKDKVSLEIKPLKNLLKEKLERELFRVKDHYFKQIKEKDEEVETCANKIKMLQSKLRHTSYDRDISILNRLIRESKERLEMLKQKTYRERLQAEEKFHINDEVEKHVLSIKNLLINSTVFYYPTYILEVLINGKRRVLNYDPILDRLVEIQKLV